MVRLFGFVRLSVERRASMRIRKYRASGPPRVELSVCSVLMSSPSSLLTETFSSSELKSP